VTSLQAPAALAALVIVVVDGVFVPSAPPAVLRDGRVAAPASVVARIADRVALAADGTLTATRGERSCAARAAGTADPPLFTLAPLARCLGATSIAFDPRAKTLALAFGAVPVTIRTMAPFDPSSPQVSPTTIFTPEPATPTPRVIDTGSPRPRRTAIPVFEPPPRAISPRPRSL
jgi:hypothetical protein